MPLKDRRERLEHFTRGLKELRLARKRPRMDELAASNPSSPRRISTRRRRPWPSIAARPDDDTVMRVSSCRHTGLVSCAAPETIPANEERHVVLDLFSRFQLS